MLFLNLIIGLMMNKDFIKGTIVGLIAPIVAFVVYVAFYLEADVLQTFYSLIGVNKITHVISLSTLINLLIFFMNLKTNREVAAKGILLATIFYAFLVISLNNSYKIEHMNYKKCIKQVLLGTHCILPTFQIALFVR